MSSVALSGVDTVVINGRILSDLASGDCAVIEYPNEIADLKTGKNGNALYAINETGKQANLTLKLVRGSADDKFMNSLLTQQQLNFPSIVLVTGEFVKTIGNGQGTLTFDTYLMSGGIFTNQLNAKSNVEGDTDQSLVEYKMRFSNAPRALT